MTSRVDINENTTILLSIHQCQPIGPPSQTSITHDKYDHEYDLVDINANTTIKFIIDINMHIYINYVLVILYLIIILMLYLF